MYSVVVVVAAVVVAVNVAVQESYLDFMRFKDLRNQLGHRDIPTRVTARRLRFLCFDFKK